MKGKHKVPSSGPARELLRSKGQFWTPGWVADAMVAFAAHGASGLYDPGFGAGAFALAARRLCATSGRKLPYSGCDNDATALVTAAEAGVPKAILRRISHADFFDVKSLPRGASVVSNPPYIRHHRISATQKARLQSIAMATVGKTLDGRTGLHAFFLLHALRLLRQGQRLAFIVPADVCEGVYAQRLWSWIGANFRLHAVVTFDANATPFPGVDTNAVVLLLSNEPPSSRYSLVRVHKDETPALAELLRAEIEVTSSDDLTVSTVATAAALRDGVARKPLDVSSQRAFVLGDVLRTVRGVATGANDFFCLNSEQVRDLEIPRSCLARFVMRTRDVPEANFDLATLDALDAEGRPTFLLSLDGTPLDRLPRSVARYVMKGAEGGLPERALIKQRRPWFKMERRDPPPFLFAYLGRRNARFIRNLAQAVPSTSFLCVYPRPGIALDKVQLLLSDPEILDGIAFVAKTYGGGAFKVEPRALERLPVSAAVMKRHPWVASCIGRGPNDQAELELVAS